MHPKPPKSNILRQLIRTFPATEPKVRANDVGFFECKLDFEVVPFFWTLVFGFITGNDRSVQTLLDQFLSQADDVDSLTYTSFRNWFTPELLDFLQDFIEDYAEALGPRHDQLEGRLARFRDVLIRNGTVVTLAQSAADVYPATTDGEAACTLHITESLERGVHTEVTLTDG